MLGTVSLHLFLLFGLSSALACFLFLLCSASKFVCLFVFMRTIPLLLPFKSLGPIPSSFSGFLSPCLHCVCSPFLFLFGLVVPSLPWLLQYLLSAWLAPHHFCTLGIVSNSDNDTLYSSSSLLKSTSTLTSPPLYPSELFGTWCTNIFHFLFSIDICRLAYDVHQLTTYQDVVLMCCH